MPKQSRLRPRCTWCLGHQIYEDYHDKEWGRPVHDDRKIFEAIALDAFQAGLSWLTILKKRENFRAAFDNFDAKKIARYDRRKIKSLMNDAGIVRNKLKIESTVTNAAAFLAVQKEFGSFDKYIWSFVGGRTIKNRRKIGDKIPATSPESDAMSRDLKSRGFRFVGSTICYAFMQATGMVNDHVQECFCSRN